MSSTFHIIKVAVSVIAGIAAAVCIFFALGYAGPLALVSIAFSQMPE